VCCASLEGGAEIVGHKMCILIFSIRLSETFLIFLSYFNKNVIFSADFQKVLNHENSPSGGQVVPRLRQTDRSKLIVTFHNFVEAPETAEVPLYTPQTPSCTHSWYLMEVGGQHHDAATLALGEGPHIPIAGWVGPPSWYRHIGE